MNNLASRRDLRNKPFEVSERTLPANTIVGRNLADCVELPDPCEDFPDLRSEDIALVELPTAQITNIFQKLNDTLQSLREHTVKTLSLKSIAQDACVNARGYDFEKMYYDEANRAKDLELELRVVKEGYESLSKEKEIMMKNYEGFISNLQTENKNLKSLEVKVSQLDSQKRRMEEDVQRLLFENRLLKEQEHQGNKTLLEELKAKIKKYNEEKMEYLNRLEEHQNEVTELTHQLESTRQSQLSENENYQRVIENFRLENERLKDQLKQAQAQIEKPPIAEPAKNDQQIELIKKEIEMLKLHVVNASFDSVRISQNLRSTSIQEVTNNTGKNPHSPGRHFDAFSNQAINRDLSSMRETGIINGKQSTSFAQMTPLNSVSTHTIDFTSYPSEDNGTFEITKNEGVKVQRTMEPPNLETKIATVSPSRDFSKSPNVSTTRRIIRLGDADNPFTRGLSTPQITSIVGNNQQEVLPKQFPKLTFDPPKSLEGDMAINFILPDTMSIAGSDHFEEHSEATTKHQPKALAVGTNKQNNTTTSGHQSTGQNSLDIHPNTLRPNRDDESLDASINHRQEEDSMLTSDSRIQEVFDELNG